ncbi:ion transporter [bacterium]|nr:MAG: ion transporter [bacterium]
MPILIKRFGWVLPGFWINGSPQKPWVGSFPISNHRRSQRGGSRIAPFAILEPPRPRRVNCSVARNPVEKSGNSEPQPLSPPEGGGYTEAVGDSTEACALDAGGAPADSPLAKAVGSRAFHDTVLGLIVLNAVLLGLETYPSVREAAGPLIEAADRVILWLFTAEVAARAAAAGSAAEFWKDPWHRFDAAVVAAGWVPGGQFLTVVRLFRLLRVLRTITLFPNLQRLVTALLRSMPALGNVGLILGGLFYVYGTAGTFLYADVAPQYFGSLHRTFLTLFAVITLEDWLGIMGAVSPANPWCWTYFVSFIVLGTFVALNSFIAVIVAQLERLDDEDQLAVLGRLEQRLARIEERLEKGRQAPTS